MLHYIMSAQAGDPQPEAGQQVHRAERKGLLLRQGRLLQGGQRRELKREEAELGFDAAAVVETYCAICSNVEIRYF